MSMYIIIVIIHDDYFIVIIHDDYKISIEI
jgi:hypothetical protein